jgi:tetratricopeptide (TPR) repeat protein
MKPKFLGCAALLCSLWVHAAERDFTPASNTQVIEKLAPRVRTVAKDPEKTAQAVRAAINLARETADPRYLGRAQALLAPWWDQAETPPDLAVLQATVLQSKHDFAAARLVLQKVVSNQPRHAQAWLTLATLNRLQADYASALKACRNLAHSGAAFYAQACLLETQSLQGQYAVARQGFSAVLANKQDAATQAWIWSLTAENEARAGSNAAALTAYRQSLALQNDSYTAIAAADLLLDLGQNREALHILQTHAESDAVLLRRAYALKRLGESIWKAHMRTLQARFAASQQRGDDTAAHAREHALLALWLEDDAQAAAQAAAVNFARQKEPIDWWLALQAAQAAGQMDRVAAVQKQLQASGLRDAKLAPWQNAAAGKP